MMQKYSRFYHVWFVKCRFSADVSLCLTFHRNKHFAIRWKSLVLRLSNAVTNVCYNSYRISRPNMNHIFWLLDTFEWLNDIGLTVILFMWQGNFSNFPKHNVKIFHYIWLRFDTSNRYDQDWSIPVIMKIIKSAIDEIFLFQFQFIKHDNAHSSATYLFAPAAFASLGFLFNISEDCRFKSTRYQWCLTIASFITKSSERLICGTGKHDSKTDLQN